MPEGLMGLRDVSLRMLLLVMTLGSSLPHHPKAHAEPRTTVNAGDNAEPTIKQPPADPVDICRTLAQAALDNQLPVDFFSRLIWQESRFDAGAVSSKGAQGIAQFMPRTALERRLVDPFESLQALRESASYLRELRTTFDGNLGLAAAAYNAGPGRVEAWRAGRRSLPGETQAYVRIITGRTVESWVTDPLSASQASDLPKAMRCVEVAKLITRTPGRPSVAANAAWDLWGVQLAGNWTDGQVLASYERLRRTYASVLSDRAPLILRGRLPGKRGATKYLVRVSANSRQTADALCIRLRTAGCACIVLRNPA